MPDDVRSLYRRWRSRTFSELIGQDHVSQTLLNALATGRVAHAYLFSGPRGSGKTSTARILAKAVNCLNNGGAGEPCNTCEMCLAINEGRALDLIEIDAASNRGIDEIRDLRDKVHFSPTSGRYKVYILDEAHMLTNEAFNALLKTLEEPPAHVIFALVTTESHKIPPTILSRCQRFDFHRASGRDLLAKLNHICQEEHIKVEPEALTVIARTATGSYRDAESLLDQLASFSGDQGITLGYLQQVLGLAPLDATSTLVGHIASRDVAAGIQHLTGILQSGTDLRQFTRQLIDYLRDLMLIKTGNETLLDTTDQALAQMKAHAALLPLPEFVRLIKLFSDPEVANGLRASTQPQLPLELAFLEACASPHSAANAPSAPAASSAAEHLRNADPASRQAVAPPPVHASPSAASGPATTTSAAHTRPPVSARSTDMHAPAARAAASTETRYASASPAAAVRGAAPTSPAATTRPAPAARPPLQPVVTAPPGTPLASVQENWPSILEAVKGVSRSVEAFLKECHPVAADENGIVLAFNYAFHRESVDNQRNRLLVEEACSKVLARTVKIQCTLSAREGKSASGAVALKDKTASSGEDAVVEKAKQMFGGNVVGVDKLSQ